MAGLVPQFEAQLAISGSDVIYHREDEGAYRCPCITAHGDRDAELHFRQRNGWFYTDHAVTDGGAGNLTGTFTYGVAPIMGGVPLGEPAIVGTITVAAKQVSVATDVAAGKFESIGRSVPTQLRIYRRTGAGSWRQVGDIAPGAAIIDNTADRSASVIAPPECNERGWVVLSTGLIDILVKGFVQPIQSTRATRLSSEYLIQLFGEIEADDHLGIFPLEWAGTALYFHEWSDSGEDFIVYRGRRFFVVNANEIPDPSDGLPHHWEVGLRLVRDRG